MKAFRTSLVVLCFVAVISACTFASDARPSVASPTIPIVLTDGTGPVPLCPPSSGTCDTMPKPNLSRS